MEIDFNTIHSPKASVKNQYIHFFACLLIGLIFSKTYLILPALLVPMFLCLIIILPIFFKPFVYPKNFVIGYFILAVLISVFELILMMNKGIDYTLIPAFVVILAVHLFIHNGRTFYIKAVLRIGVLLFIFQIFLSSFNIHTVRAVPLSSEELILYEAIEPLQRFVWNFIGKSMFFLNSNEVGYIFSIFAILFFVKDSPFYSKFFGFLCLFLAILSLSRAAIIVLIFLSFVFFPRKKLMRVILFILFTLITLVLIYNPLYDLIITQFSGEDSNNERLMLAIEGLYHINENPFLSSYFEYYKFNIIGPHNEFIESMLRGGMIFMCLQFLAIYLILDKSNISFLCILLISLFTHNLINTYGYMIATILLMYSLKPSQDSLYLDQMLKNN